MQIHFYLLTSKYKNRAVFKMLWSIGEQQIMNTLPTDVPNYPVDLR